MSKVHFTKKIEAFTRATLPAPYLLSTSLYSQKAFSLSTARQKRHSSSSNATGNPCVSSIHGGAPAHSFTLSLPFFFPLAIPCPGIWTYHILAHRKIFLPQEACNPFLRSQWPSSSKKQQHQTHLSTYSPQILLPFTVKCWWDTKAAASSDTT